MRRPELIFLHSVSADGFDVPACDFQKLVALSQEGPDPSLPANSAAQQKRFASRISSPLFATRSSRPATRRGQARSSAVDRDVERLRDSKKEASRGTCGSSYWCCGAGTRNTDRQFWICVSRFPLEVPSAYKTFVSSTSASSRSPFGSDLGKLGQQIGIRGRPSNG
jgi:hypothetical protein